MSDFAKIFAVNTYSYTFDRTAADCIRHLADQGYPAFELMMYPGHLWPSQADETTRRDIRRACDNSGTRLLSFNMPNIDLNIVGATQPMRDYSVGILSQFITLASELEVPALVIGPGKANPLFAPSDEFLLGHFFTALDHLYPIAEKGGVRLLVENMPFAFLPSAAALTAALGQYGNDYIGIVYDIANGHFIGEDPCDGLRTVKRRLGLVHLSDTGKSVYRHDPVGLGDVPFADVPPVLKEVGYSEFPVLEVISRNPDVDTLESAKKLAGLGYAARK